MHQAVRLRLHKQDIGFAWLAEIAALRGRPQAPPLRRPREKHERRLWAAVSTGQCSGESVIWLPLEKPHRPMQDQGLIDEFNILHFR